MHHLCAPVTMALSNMICYCWLTGSARNPTTSAARTLFIVLFVLAVLTYTAYSASIISLLSSPTSVTSTLQGILRHGSKMGLALLNIHYYHAHFKVQYCTDKYLHIFNIKHNMKTWYTHTVNTLHHMCVCVCEANQDKTI